MDPVLDMVVKWSVPFILGGVVAWLGRQGSVLKAFRNGLQALLRDRIIQAFNYHTSKGYCRVHELENVVALYTQYKALGGNGTICKLVDRIKALPTAPPGEK